MSPPSSVSLVEVGPRDGFQPVGPMIPTDRKIELVAKLHAAGLRRIEATAFVSDTAIPQLADAAEVLQAAQTLRDLDVQVLVPNVRYAIKALEAGAQHLAFVLSASEKHNLNNVRRPVADSMTSFRDLVASLPDSCRLRFNLATAFDCPFDGPVDPNRVLDLLEQMISIRADMEIALCDTTGRVTPRQVAALFSHCIGRWPVEARWAYHGHDTYGLGVANVLAAFEAGVRVFDASFGGLGGCPFAPGATGNVATEDVVWTFDAMGVETGVDLQALLPVATAAAALPGASAGGRIRDALTTRMAGMAA